MRKSQIQQFFAFFWGSAMGLAIDLVGFQVLVGNGFLPLLANALSSSLSVTAVYFLVTRFSFGARAQLSKYVFFLLWYGSSIVLFSIVIQLAVFAFGWQPLVCKLVSVPISFALNYFFSRYLFRNGGSVTGAEAAPV